MPQREERMNNVPYWIIMSVMAMRQPITKTRTMMNSALRSSDSAFTDSEKKVEFRHAYTHIHRIDVQTMLRGSLLLV